VEQGGEEAVKFQAAVLYVLSLFAGTAAADSYLLLHARVAEGSQHPRSLVLSKPTSRSRVQISDAWNSQFSGSTQLSLRDTPTLAKLRAKSYSVSAIRFSARQRENYRGDGMLPIRPAPLIRIEPHTIHYFGDLSLDNEQSAPVVSVEMDTLREACEKFPELMNKHPIVIQPFGKEPKRFENFCARLLKLAVDEN
jgi:hypothetical protein